MTHLHVHSPYSLLNGGSSIEALVKTAAGFGMTALALTDTDTVAGAVKFVDACRGFGIRPILGAEVTLEDQSRLTLLAEDRAGYASLCRLLSCSYERGGRLTPALPWAELAAHTEGLLCLSGDRGGRIPSLLRDYREAEAEETAKRLRDCFGPERFYLELVHDLTPGSYRVCRRLAELGQTLGIGVVATNSAHYATPDDAIAFEVVRCIRTKTTVESIHSERPLNAEQWLKPAAEMARLFAWCPEAVENAGRLAERCGPALPGGEEVTPRYGVPEGHADARAYLRHLVYKGAQARYGHSYGARDGRLGPRVRERLEHEMGIITRLGFDDYFLMVWSVTRWARSQGIRCTGRGSAADSCVAYCLHLTDVDVLESDLPFARFLTEGKTPDIDIDFDNSRRDEVFVHAQEKYGREHVAMVCAFSTFQAKAAVRDVGKALQLPPDLLTFLSDHLSHFVSADGIEAAFGRLAELREHQRLKERCRLLFDLCARIADFPRHIQTHSSGLVISRVPLDSLAPLQPTAKGLLRILHLDKDDAEAVGLIKFDVLALGILAAVEDAVSDIRQRQPSFRYERIGFQDEETYRMLRGGGAVGVFQFESAAQINLAQRLWIDSLKDLTAAVALIRPGPVKGDAVQRFIAARNGWARPYYVHPCLYPVLKRTYGVIVFQEQVVGVIAAMLGIGEGQADRFRKDLKKHSKAGTMEACCDDFVRRATARHPDLSAGKAELLFRWISSWSGYGFVEGHAASFAITGYRSAYLSRHYPAHYFAGLLSNQPMGYYSPNSLAAEARRRGIAILPLDINASEDRCVAPTEEAIRLGFCLVAELTEADREAIVAARRARPFASLLDFCVRVPMHLHRIENLVLAGAFDSLHDSRRGLLWRLNETLGLALLLRAEGAAGANGAGGGQGRFDYGPFRDMETPCADIADLSPWEKFRWHWLLTGVSAECHVFSWLRPYLATRRVLTTYEAMQVRPGTRVTVAGINVQPHRPPTKSGEPILFTSIEDEWGVLQATVTGQAILDTTATFMTSPAVLVRGIMKQSGRGRYLLVEKAKPLRMQEFAGKGQSSEDLGRLVVAPPTRRTYPGTKLTATATEVS